MNVRVSGRASGEIPQDLAILSNPKAGASASTEGEKTARFVDNTPDRLLAQLTSRDGAQKAKPADKSDAEVMERIWNAVADAAASAAEAVFGSSTSEAATPTPAPSSAGDAAAHRGAMRLFGGG